MADRRANLVAIRAGAQSLHRTWQLPYERTWDLATLVYDSTLLEEHQTESSTVPGDAVEDSRAHPFKFHGLKAFFAEDPIRQQYKNVFFPDDDLIIDPSAIDSLFEVFTGSGAAFGQPALTWNSHHSHFITLQNRAFHYRHTNFSEVMCPLMTGRFLRSVLHTFAPITPRGDWTLYGATFVAKGTTVSWSSTATQ